MLFTKLFICHFCFYFAKPSHVIFSRLLYCILGIKRSIHPSFLSTCLRCRIVIATSGPLPIDSLSQITKVSEKKVIFIVFFLHYHDIFSCIAECSEIYFIT